MCRCWSVPRRATLQSKPTHAFQFLSATSSLGLCAISLQLTVQSWRLAWTFTAGETLEEAADYFPNTSYPLPGSLNTSGVQIQSTALTASDAQQAVQNAWFYPSQVRMSPTPAPKLVTLTLPKKQPLPVFVNGLRSRLGLGLEPGTLWTIAPLHVDSFAAEQEATGDLPI